MTKLVKMLMCALLLCTQLMAQNRTVTGKVTDDKGVPVANASVVAKGSRQGTTTNAEGTFSLSVPASVRVLTVSSVNFAAQDVTISANNTVAVTLAASTALLDEVVVVGYSTTTKQAFTGTAKQISGEELNKKSVSSVSQALAGEVAGVRVINTSGQPGTNATVRIRGLGSVNGNRSPLYVVDGIPFDGALNGINTADVASMTVLKDAAATAIYGSRGANGVIVITTTSGRGKKPYIEVDGRFGSNMSLLPRYETIKSPEEYIGLSWESMYNYAAFQGSTNPTAYANTNLFSTGTLGIAPFYNMWNVATVADLIDPVTRTVKPGVTRKYDPENWADYAFQASNRTETNIKMGGGDAKTNYYTSVGYLQDKGYSINTDFTRLSFRVNLNHEVKSWLSTSFNANYSNAITNNNGQGSSSNSIFWFVDNLPSIYPLFLRDATGAKVPDPIFGGFQYDYGAGTGKSRGFGGLTNAIADAIYNTSRSTRNDLNGSASVKLKFTKDLTLENRLGMQYYTSLGVSRGNKFYGGSAPQNGSLFHTRNEQMNLNLLTMARYAHRFSAHNVEVLAAHESTKYKFSTFGAGGNNLVLNDGLELDNAIVKVPGAVTSNNTLQRLESYFGQVNYDYAGKYYLAGTVRADGSSRFRNDKWGTFYSVGLGWEVTKEDFMKKGSILSYLKLKASYGVLGDQAGFGSYSGYNQIQVSNLNDLPSFAPQVVQNPNLTWETSRMAQVGAEFRLGTFLEGSVDYYVKNTNNMLFNRSIGISNGYASLPVNDANLRNSGIEFELTGHVIKRKDFWLDLNVNGEHFKNQLTEMPLDPSTGGPKYLDVQGLYGYGKGHSLYDYYTRQYAGVDAATGVSQWTVYYDDLNSNNAFDAGEQIASLEQFKIDNPSKANSYKQGITKTYSQATLFYTGQSALPKLRGAFNLNAGFKNLDISVQFLYSIGGYAFDGLYQGLMASGAVGNNNWHVDMRNRWQKAGDITDVPRLSNNLDANNNGTSTRFLAKADYLALNNVRIGYTLPTKTVQALGIQQATFYVSGDNLYLASARKGLNPSTAEAGGSNTYLYSPLSTISAGVKVRF
ncbi:SusC/RagA family TonB-linked outer membrane protein [Sediminibacterium roseum]|uniref:SusC/RagA family TonB-linked outer membrane protein n=1 Tax=Sediminibacterium roseum TaxID=1978412 RepID=A0ABW9ZQ64_9BACT|nr:SusC/RagA family TonB-linked outer membrane protein [Sediminibacterium roseum]NCI48622.1 SusC/RagA family TonB-linked outer membrane protein [Sediminibacterium roseum]